MRSSSGGPASSRRLRRRWRRCHRSGGGSGGLRPRSSAITGDRGLPDPAPSDHLRTTSKDHHHRCIRVPDRPAGPRQRHRRGGGDRPGPGGAGPTRRPATGRTHQSPETSGLQECPGPPDREHPDHLHRRDGGTKGELPLRRGSLPGGLPRTAELLFEPGLRDRMGVILPENRGKQGEENRRPGPDGARAFRSRYPAKAVTTSPQSVKSPSDNIAIEASCG